MFFCSDSSSLPVSSSLSDSLSDFVAFGNFVSDVLLVLCAHKEYFCKSGEAVIISIESLPGNTKLAHQPRSQALSSRVPRERDFGGGGWKSLGTRLLPHLFPGGMDGKKSGMLVVPFGGQTVRFWYRCGCSRLDAILWKLCGSVPPPPHFPTPAPTPGGSCLTFLCCCSSSLDSLSCDFLSWASSSLSDFWAVKALTVKTGKNETSPPPSPLKVWWLKGHFTVSQTERSGFEPCPRSLQLRSQGFCFLGGERDPELVILLEPSLLPAFIPIDYFPRSWVGVRTDYHSSWGYSAKPFTHTICLQILATSKPVHGTGFHTWSQIVADITDHIPTPYQPHPHHVPTTYQQDTNHIPTTYRHTLTAMLHCLGIWLLQEGWQVNFLCCDSPGVFPHKKLKDKRGTSSTLWCNLGQHSLEALWLGGVFWESVQRGKRVCPQASQWRKCCSTHWWERACKRVT